MNPLGAFPSPASGVSQPSATTTTTTSTTPSTGSNAPLPSDLLSQMMQTLTSGGAGNQAQVVYRFVERLFLKKYFLKAIFASAPSTILFVVSRSLLFGFLSVVHHSFSGGPKLGVIALLHN